VEDVITDASHGFLQKYTVESTSKRWTVREAVLHHGLGIGAMKLVGTPEQIADKLEKMSIEGDVDGFNIIQAASPVTLEEFVDHVVPVLQARGIYRKEYEANTLRENLFGKGNIHLPNRHPAKKVSISLQEAQSI
jgi:long-chain alkane monooxygenase